MNALCLWEKCFSNDEFGSLMSVNGRGQLILSGTIVAGVGKGRQYLLMPEFMHQFEHILGAPPYPGTLNIMMSDVGPTDQRKLEELRGERGIIIHGFVKHGEHFFPGVSLRCTLTSGDIEHSALVFFPERTVHPPEVFEVITVQRILDAADIGDQVIIRI